DVVDSPQAPADPRRLSPEPGSPQQARGALADPGAPTHRRLRMKIVLPLPVTLTSLFIVTLINGGFVPWRLTGPCRKAAMAALGTPRLRLTHHPTPWQPTAVTLPPDERHLLRRSRHHLAVSTTVPPHDLPAAVQAARA